MIQLNTINSFPRYLCALRIAIFGISGGIFIGERRSIVKGRKEIGGEENMRYQNGKIGKANQA